MYGKSSEGKDKKMAMAKGGMAKDKKGMAYGGMAKDKKMAMAKGGMTKKGKK